MPKIDFDNDEPIRGAEGFLLGAILGSVFWLAVFFVIGWFA